MRIDVEKKIDSIFSNSGPLAEKFKTYQIREGQVQMAKAIADSHLKKEHLIVEAGTGTGKSFAYLIPSLLLKNKRYPIVLSTGTIALQEQLLEKDIPQLVQILNYPIKAILAKGRSNYICEHRFNRAKSDLNSIAEDTTDLETLEKLKGLIGKSTFSKSNLPGPLSHTAWTQICSETGLCGQGKCKETPCSFVRARQEMVGADIIVVNHSLLFVHLQLMAAGVSLLPKFENLILDEAHHCPDVASEQFGVQFSNSRIKFFLDRLYNFHKNKGFLAKVKPRPVVIIDKVNRVRDESYQFFESLRNWYENEGPENGRLSKRVSFEIALLQSLKELSGILSNWAGSSENQDEEREFRYYAESALNFHMEMKAFIEMQINDAAYWVELGREGRYEQQCSARIAYIDISSRLKELTVDKFETIVMTSATLATGGVSFEYYKKRMGLDDSVRALIVSSPFNFIEQVGLMSFKKISLPNSNTWEKDIIKFTMACINLTKGGVFILVTSYALLNKIHHALLQETKYKILAQGLSGSREQLISQFCANGNAILIGNQTFWEGIDIPGKALRNVIIPRLPFEVPTHPLQEARVEYLTRKGKDPFKEIALPHAIMRLKQGFGRLVRRTSDMGLVCILDSRLHKKNYGKFFLEALPLCNQFVDSAPNENFLKKLEKYIASNE